MKTKNLFRLVKWFCRELTFDELASVVLILHEVLSGFRRDIELKPDPRPPHFREFKVDTIPPLEFPSPVQRLDWRELQEQNPVSTVRRRKNSVLPPEWCTCEHCKAPARYLYVNDGKKRSQVRCKICKGLSPIHRIRIESKARYWCPYCGSALYKWKENINFTAFKCSGYKCPHYLENLKKLTPEERLIRAEGKTSQFKLHYQFREYHFSPNELKAASLEQPPKVDLHRIHNNYHVLGLVLTFVVNLGLSSRVTRDALRGIFGIKLSHQTVINYVNAAAFHLYPFIRDNCPLPKGKAAADETYIMVENRWFYTWMIIGAESRAVCGFNLSDNRGTRPALALLQDCYGKPTDNNTHTFELITDGNPSYDAAVMEYNRKANADKLLKYKVIGLENLDSESEEYRPFKQLIERLNRTYKYHTRPRAGFKSFNGALALTILFVAFYNFMRPHSARNGKTPVEIECLKNSELYPDKWCAFLKAA
jgi:transposase-like protein